MRRTFADILNDAEVDVSAEYRSLHTLVFQRYGFYGDMEGYFHLMPFAGTACNLKDFNERNGFNFESVECTKDLDDLLLFCEYVYNFAARMNVFDDCYLEKSFGIARHIGMLVDKLRYRFVEHGDLWVLVPEDEKIEAAAEVAPPQAGNDLFRYDYRAYRGDVDGKRKILVSLATSLEPHRARLAEIAKEFTNNYFYLVNSLNIRHNNVEPVDTGKYKEFVAQMPEDELEGWYDTVRYMSAAAFLLLEYGENAQSIKDLKRGY